MKHAILLLSALIMFGFSDKGNSYAEQAKDERGASTLEEIERDKGIGNKEKMFKEAEKAADLVLGLADEITEKKRQDCISAFGNKGFCECLAN